MKLLWKIFKIANVVQIVLISSALIAIIYLSGLSFNGTYDVLTFVFFLSITILNIANSICNILMLRCLTFGTGITVKRIILFWVLSILSLIVIFLCSWVGVELYFDLKKNLSFYKAVNYRFYVGLIWIVSFIVNGSLILCLQLLLFYRVKQQAKKLELQVVDTLGENIS